MSKFKSLFTIILFLFSIQLFAQSSEEFTTDDTDNSTEQKESSFSFKTLLRPEISIGSGVLTFLGDIGYNEFQQPLQNKIGFHGYLTYHLTPAFDVNMGYIQGDLYGNRDNVNFKSAIRLGQLNFSYNFRNFYKKNDFKLHPFVYAGVQAMVFQTYLDLSSPQGAYHYWSDGTIRRSPETAENITIANSKPDKDLVDQDYIFEKNARYMNYNGLGVYPAFILSVPVGAGLNLKLTKHLSAKFATTLNFAYSDVIDGTTAENFTIKKGNKLNDNFLYTHFSLGYDFGAKSEQDDTYGDVDYLALTDSDTDGDGVNDFNDECEETPVGVAVNEKGCPLDDDGDGVPNYKDDEATTAAGAFVNDKGVTLTQEQLVARYQVYIDSTGKYIPTSMLDAGKTVYKVQILEGNIPQDQLEQFLALDELETRVLPDGTQKHTVGIFTDKEDAAAKAKQLNSQGFSAAQVVEEAFEPERIIASVAHKKSVSVGSSTTPEGRLEGGESIAISGSGTNSTKGTSSQSSDLGEKGLIYRIQIGAFSQPVPSTAFKGVPVIVAPAGNGITRYLTGNFKDYDAAFERKKVLIDNGFDGAFVVAYKDGRQTSISSTARTAIESSTVTDKTPINYKVPEASYSDDIRYRVQIGAYTSAPPAEVVDKASNLSKETLDNGITRYFSGNYKTYEEAITHQKELENQGVQGSFVTAYKTGNKISLKETGDVKPTNNNTTTPASKTENKSNINPNTIVFKIQLGLYQSTIPNNELNKFLLVKNIKAEQTAEGATRYTAGSFDNIEDAQNYKQEIESKGIQGSFIIAFSEGNLIPLDEAIKAKK